MSCLIITLAIVLSAAEVLSSQYHGSTTSDESLPNGYQVDPHQVAGANGANLVTQAHRNQGYHGGENNHHHGDFRYHGPTITPKVLHDGHITHPHEVAAAKENHFAAVSDARSEELSGNRNEWSDHDQSFEEPQNVPYQGPTANPQVLHSGFLQDTPEVVAAKSQHLSAVAQTKTHGEKSGHNNEHSDHGSYSIEVNHESYHRPNQDTKILQAGYLSGTHEVAAINHLLAKSSIHGKPSDYYSKQSGEPNPEPYQGPTANPEVLQSGYLQDTPEVVAAKARHLSAIAKVTTSEEHNSPNHDHQSNHGFSHEDANHTPYHKSTASSETEILQSGYLTDDPEVVPAKAMHLSDGAKTRSHEAYDYQQAEQPHRSGSSANHVPSQGQNTNSQVHYRHTVATDESQRLPKTRTRGGHRGRSSQHAGRTTHGKHSGETNYLPYYASTTNSRPHNRHDSSPAKSQQLAKTSTQVGHKGHHAGRSSETYSSGAAIDHDRYSGETNHKPLNGLTANPQTLQSELLTDTHEVFAPKSQQLPKTRVEQNGHHDERSDQGRHTGETNRASFHGPTDNSQAIQPELYNQDITKTKTPRGHNGQHAGRSNQGRQAEVTNQKMVHGPNTNSQAIQSELITNTHGVVAAKDHHISKTKTREGHDGHHLERSNHGRHAGETNQVTVHGPNSQGIQSEFLTNTHEVVAAKDRHQIKTRTRGGYNSHHAGRSDHGSLPGTTTVPYHGPLADPQVLPSGYLADTSEVAAAKAKHHSALSRAKSQEGHRGNHELFHSPKTNSQAPQSELLTNTNEVVAVIDEPLIKVSTRGRYTGHHTGRSTHNRHSVETNQVPFHGRTAQSQTIQSGFLSDTNDRVKDQHVSAVSKARSQGGYSGQQAGRSGSRRYPGHVTNVPYHGPLADPRVLPSGYLADTSEVAAAKAKYLSAISRAKPQEGHSGNHELFHSPNTNSQALLSELLTNTHEMATAKDQHLTKTRARVEHTGHHAGRSNNGRHAGETDHALFYRLNTNSQTFQSEILKSTHEGITAKNQHQTKISTRGEYTGHHAERSSYGTHSAETNQVPYHGRTAQSQTIQAGVLSDANEVIKDQHVSAISKARSQGGYSGQQAGRSGSKRYPGGATNVPYHGPLADPRVLPSGYLEDTSEVAAAKAEHLSALSKAAHSGHHARGSDHSSYPTESQHVSNHGATSSVPKSLGQRPSGHQARDFDPSSNAGSTNHGSLAWPVVLPSGYLADTEEVAAARERHLLAHRLKLQELSW